MLYQLSYSGAGPNPTGRDPLSGPTSAKACTGRGRRAGWTPQWTDRAAVRRDVQARSRSSGRPVVLVLFVIAVTILVAVGTRPSVSGGRAPRRPRRRPPRWRAAAPRPPRRAGRSRPRRAAGATTTTSRAHMVVTRRPPPSPRSSVSVVVANATHTNGLAAHYSTVIGGGGWTMETPSTRPPRRRRRPSTTPPGFQQPAAAIATAIGVKPTQVLPLTTATPRQRRHRHRRGRGHRRGPRRRRPAPDVARGGRCRGAAPRAAAPLAAEPAHGALFLDFDGTLAAIVEDPTAARPLPGVPALLAELGGHVRAGRGRLGPADRLPGRRARRPAGVTLAGLYGLERALRGHRARRLGVGDRRGGGRGQGRGTRGRLRRAQGPDRHAALAPRVPEHKDWVLAFAGRQHARARPGGARGSPRARAAPPARRSTRGRWCARWRPSTPGSSAPVAVFGDDMGDLPGLRRRAAS